MKNFGTKIALFVASLCAGSFLIRHFGVLYANGEEGFRHGNRCRVVSILRLEWLMLHLDLIIYLHVFSIFSLPHVILKFSNGTKASTTRLKLLRFRCFCVFLAVVFFAHLLYFLYLFESVPVPSLLYDLSGICNGIWLHLSAFAVFFVAMNIALDQMMAHFEWLRHFLEERVFRRLSPMRLFCRVPQFQVLFTLAVSAAFCLTHWYYSDKIFTRHLTIPMANAGRDAGHDHFRVAVLTDLHAGASVYYEQIAEVVDRVNALKDLDAVFIIGDAVDAPRSLIERRVWPLRHLRSRLGTFFVTGNHEYYYGNVDEWIALFNDYGIRTLRNQAQMLKNVCVVGLDDISSDSSGIYGHRMDVSALSKCPPRRPVVVLAHNPAATDEILRYANTTRRHVDVILSGHTHASQYYVMAPYIYWLLPYFYGVYEVTAADAMPPTTLLVSAGTLYQGGPMKMPFMSQIWFLDLAY